MADAPQRPLTGTNATERTRSKRLGCTRIVSGSTWLEGPSAQDREWRALRVAFGRYLTEQGIDLIERPAETTEYDEQLGQVRLHIRVRVP